MFFLLWPLGNTSLGSCFHLPDPLQCKVYFLVGLSLLSGIRRCYAILVYFMPQFENQSFLLEALVSCIREWH